MDKLKAAVIGLGVGESHVETYLRHSLCELVAVCDLAEYKLRMFREKHPDIQTTSDADTILEDPSVNVVSIASYDQYHASQAARAIENGKHVFVEKPLCLHEDEARRLAHLLERHPRVKLSSNLILRLSPRFLELKTMVSRGEYGDLYYLEGDYNYGKIHKITDGWRGAAEFYSVVLGGGVHMIDLLQWLSGVRIVEVAAYGTRIATANTRFRFDDMVVSILRFENGAIGKMTANFSCVHPHFHGLKIFGTSATFNNAIPNGKMTVSRKAETAPRSVVSDYPGIHKGDLLWRFIDHIHLGAESIIETKEVFGAMAVCFAIERSLQSGGSVPVTYLM